MAIVCALQYVQLVTTVLAAEADVISVALIRLSAELLGVTEMEDA